MTPRSPASGAEVSAGLAHAAPAARALWRGLGPVVAGFRPWAPVSAFVPLRPPGSPGPARGFPRGSVSVRGPAGPPSLGSVSPGRSGVFTDEGWRQGWPGALSIPARRPRPLPGSGPVFRVAGVFPQPCPPGVCLCPQRRVSRLPSRNCPLGLRSAASFLRAPGLWGGVKRPGSVRGQARGSQPCWASVCKASGSWLLTWTCSRLLLLWASSPRARCVCGVPFGIRRGGCSWDLGFLLCLRDFVSLRKRLIFIGHLSSPWRTLPCHL